MSTITTVAEQPACTDWSWMCWVEAHPGLSSWVQAVGAIVALAVAILIPLIATWIQHARLRKVACAIGSDSLRILESNLKYWTESHGTDDRYAKDRVTAHALAMDIMEGEITTVSATDLGSVGATVIWCDFVTHTRVSIRLARALNYDSSEEEREVLRAMIEMARERLDKYCKSVGLRSKREVPA